MSLICEMVPPFCRHDFVFSIGTRCDNEYKPVYLTRKFFANTNHIFVALVLVIMGISLVLLLAGIRVRRCSCVVSHLTLWLREKT